ncbi:MATE family efflux transporter [Pseudomonas guariconensis]|uniref:MATE family efflux transporter n=1 Tax=Pseudomonas guariconensis TaxID=1288410 RepID=UPI0018ABC1AE|nr:MATE family efflux transporter [Pseudomonas guariconensis]MBF8722528.1 MATE family efflux transporter [Pseudomonas guariconensis]
MSVSLACRRTTWLAELPALLRLALPLVLGLSASELISLTDTLMLASLGTVVLACVSLTASAGLIFHAGLYGMLATLSVRVGHAFGAGDTHAVARTLRAGLGYGLLLGILGCLAMIAILPVLEWAGVPLPAMHLLEPYWQAMAVFLIPFCLAVVFKDVLEAIGRPWVAVMVVMSAVLFNIPLSYGLIHDHFGLPALGLMGAGIASVLAEGLAVLLALTYWRLAPSLAVYRCAAPGKRLAWRTLLGEGWPLGLGYLAEAGAVVVAAWMLGWLGTAALAANQVVQSIGGLLYMLPLGMAAAVSIRISQAQGRGEGLRISAIGSATFISVTAWMAASTVLLALFGRRIAEAMSDDPQVIAIAVPMFVVVAAMQVADGLQSTALGALRGLQDYRWPVGVTLVSYWLLALPLSYGLAFHSPLGAVGVWVGFAAGLAVAAVLLPRRFYRLQSQAASGVACARSVDGQVVEHNA